MSYTQTMFIRWLSATSGQPQDAVRRRYDASIAAIEGGHAGAAFRAFCDTSYGVFSVFTDDSPAEIERSYQFHGHLHFLRMLSYDEPDDTQVAQALARFGGGETVTILDYGCGLAHWSRALARRLASTGRECVLYLADLPTCRTGFLEWEAAQQSYRTVLLTSDASGVHAGLPAADLIFATEMLEHVAEPQSYLSAFDRVLNPGGALIADLSLHDGEFMHLSPDLRGLADQLRAWGYRDIFPACWQKPVSAAAAVDSLSHTLGGGR